MITTPNTNKWTLIGGRTYLGKNGDTVQWIDHNTAIINGTEYKGNQFIRSIILKLTNQ